MKYWFGKATAVQIDHPIAWSNMRWGLEPKWFGSANARLALGLAGIHTSRFDTDLPRAFFDQVAWIESEMGLQPGEHIYNCDEIWPQLQRVCEGYISDPSQTAFRDDWRTTYAVFAYLAANYDVAAQQLEALNWRPRLERLDGWGSELSLFAQEVSARTGPLGREIATAEANYHASRVSLALPIFQKLASARGTDPKVKKYLHDRITLLEIENRLLSGQWVDLLAPNSRGALWVGLRGNFRWLPNGDLEVHSGSDGHLLYSRLPVMRDVEVKCDVEVLQSSNGEFQAGIVAGLPGLQQNEWHAFRLKRNAVEKELACFTKGWTKMGRFKPCELKERQNEFDFRLERGVFSASVNGKQIFSNVEEGYAIRAPSDWMLVGVGAYNDLNETVVRYHKLQVRKPRGPQVAVNQ